VLLVGIYHIIDFLKKNKKKRKDMSIIVENEIHPKYLQVVSKNYSPTICGGRFDKFPK